MKTKVYLRIARTRKGFKCAASSKVSYEPLMSMKPRNVQETLPTLAFAVEFDIPDELFRQAETVAATINLKKDGAKICGTITAPEK